MMIVFDDRVELLRLGYFWMNFLILLMILVSG